MQDAAIEDARWISKFGTKLCRDMTDLIDSLEEGALNGKHSDRVHRRVEEMMRTVEEMEEKSDECRDKFARVHAELEEVSIASASSDFDFTTEPPDTGRGGEDCPVPEKEVRCQQETPKDMGTSVYIQLGCWCCCHCRLNCGFDHCRMSSCLYFLRCHHRRRGCATHGGLCQPSS
jgi:hypothetical protein